MLTRRPPLAPPAARRTVSVVSSGSLRLDLALGIGGWPCGEISAVLGPEGAGKTTLLLSCIAEAQRLGGSCAYLDADHSLDPAFAARCGVDLDRLLVCELEDGQAALGVCLTLARSATLRVIAIDPVEALLSPDELVQAPGMPAEARPGETAERILAQALASLVPALRRSGTALLLAHRDREDRGPVYHGLSAHLSRLASGLHAAVRVELQPRGPVQPAGQRVQARVVKNRFGATNLTTELDIMYNEGILKAGEVFDLGNELAIIHRLGPAYVFGDQQLGANRTAAIRLLRQVPAMCQQLEQAIRQRLSLPGPGRAGAQAGVEAPDR